MSSSTLNQWLEFDEFKAERCTYQGAFCGPQHPNHEGNLLAAPQSSFSQQPKLSRYEKELCAIQVVTKFDCLKDCCEV